MNHHRTLKNAVSSAAPTSKLSTVVATNIDAKKASAESARFNVDLGSGAATVSAGAGFNG